MAVTVTVARPGAVHMRNVARDLTCALASVLLGLLLLSGVAQAAPAVALTAPAAGTHYVAPAAIALGAQVTLDTGRSVAQVEFLANGQVIGAANAAPYSFTWTAVGQGNYTLRARVTDDAGRRTTSPGVNVQVRNNRPPNVRLEAPGHNYVAPASVVLTATVTDTDDAIARVEFYNAGTLLATRTSEPYVFTWTDVPAGTYALTARATDSFGAVGSDSFRVQVRVNTPPQVRITAPANNQAYSAPASINVGIRASDREDNLARVELLANGAPLASFTAEPFAFAWTNVPAGSYTLTARATDDLGMVTVSSPVTVRVNSGTTNLPPTVSITAPANNAVVSAPANIMLTASANDADGTVAKVDFYQGATLIGTATAAPYSFALASVAAGSYSYSAVATDNQGATTTSIAVTVIVNSPPTVNLTVPASNAGYTAPATISLAANAADADGTIAKVEFLQGTAVIATLTAAPYTFAWTNVAQGSYVLSARATDNSGASTTSAATTVSVGAAVANLYFIHPDHLDTPRLIADATGTTVWQWDNQETFGNDAPNGTPAGVGAFEFPLRFSGQYFDRETNLAYNYYRDYDPAIGRYIQSDPIGLGGGMNTFLYGDANPITQTDPLGLATNMCTRRLHNVPFKAGDLYHQYICVPDGKGGQTCGGLAPTGKMFDSPGVIEYEKSSSRSATCDEAADDNSCIEKCILDEFKKPPPNYSVDLSHGENCQTWAISTVFICQSQCKGKK